MTADHAAAAGADRLAIGAGQRRRRKTFSTPRSDMRMILAALSERAAADRRKCCAMTPVRRESQSGRPPGTTRRIVQPLIFYIKFHWWRMLQKVEHILPEQEATYRPRQFALDRYNGDMWGSFTQTDGLPREPVDH